MKTWNTFRKWAWALLISAAAVLPLQALDFGTSPLSGISSSESTIQMMEESLAQSNALLHLSETLLTRSENIDPNNANSEYVQAMLRLSLDIGTMANRIGEMANRIVYTEELIGVMADRIVTVSNALLSNNQATHTNVLAAQKNFNALLLGMRTQ